jgi:hypothetical protein
MLTVPFYHFLLHFDQVAKAAAGHHQARPNPRKMIARGRGVFYLVTSPLLGSQHEKYVWFIELGVPHLPQQPCL